MGGLDCAALERIHENIYFSSLLHFRVVYII